MSAEYTKVYAQFWNSSLADAPPFARLLFLALLSMANENGEITATTSAIARFANLPVEDVEQAMEILQAPDPDSTSPDHDGRRILRDGNHWLVVNYAKYYERGRNEDRKEYKRNWDREHAEIRHKSHKTRQNPTEPDKPDLEKKRKEKKVNPPIGPPKFSPPSIDETIAYSAEIGMSQAEAENFHDYFTSNGWKVGGRAAMKDWKSACRRWHRNEKTTGPEQRTSSAYRVPIQDAPEW